MFICNFRNSWMQTFIRPQVPVNQSHGSNGWRGEDALLKFKVNIRMGENVADLLGVFFFYNITTVLSCIGWQRMVPKRLNIKWVADCVELTTWLMAGVRGLNGQTRDKRQEKSETNCLVCSLSQAVQFHMDQGWSEGNVNGGTERGS